jgi:hypothetical protein
VPAAVRRQLPRRRAGPTRREIPGRYAAAAGVRGRVARLRLYLSVGESVPIDLEHTYARAAEAAYLS